MVSNDSTDNIVKKMINCAEQSKDNLIKLYSHQPSLGKPSCINKGVSAAKGEIVVFADSRQRFAENTIQTLVDNFADHRVGCVSGELILEETPGSSIQAEMGTYWKFEKWLRKLESDTGSVPGATGAIYAIKKELFHPLPAETLLDDVLIPIHVCMRGYRTVFDNKAIAYDNFSMNIDVEKRRKIRTLAGNWQLLFLEPKLLLPFRNPLWIRFLSHKIFRLLIPFCFIALTFTAFFLKDFHAIVFLIALFMFFLISVVPTTLQGHLKLLSGLSKIFRSVIILNYFAILAPIMLIFKFKKLW